MVQVEGLIFAAARASCLEGGRPKAYHDRSAGVQELWQTRRDCGGQVLERGQILRFIAAVALGAGPVVCVLWTRDLTANIDLPDIIALGERYPEALAQLSATSETLVTVSLSIIGATAYLVFNRWPKLPWYGLALGYLAFLSNVIALYCGARLGYLQALSLATDSPDILPLASLLDSQALFTLMSAGVLVTLAVLGRNEDVPQPAL